MNVPVRRCGLPIEAVSRFRFVLSTPLRVIRWTMPRPEQSRPQIDRARLYGPRESPIPRPACAAPTPSAESDPSRG